ncbi:MAG: alpha-glucuronidase [Clostridia bacterium]|nr:alpha-glucuronidase [Clostridia bacterium]
MVGLSRYSEYFAWLQPGAFPERQPLRLEASPGVSQTAREECVAGMERLFGKGVWAADAPVTVALARDAALPAEGYALCFDAQARRLSVRGNGNGLLYGVFALLRALATGVPLAQVAAQSAPAVPRRVIDHWDRPDGSIERGYAGRSIFFRNGALAYDAARIRDYARLLASVGVNVLNVNNVNVDAAGARLLGPEALPDLRRLADLLRPYGIRLALSVRFDSPVLLGELPTADPLDPRVAGWWRERTERVYAAVPDLDGYLIKADSEFQSGPAALGRTQADGANLLARALAPHGGIVYWRCFVYNCEQDWRDASVDRPMAAYDEFMPLDGLFEPNVILQVKNGPSDFQVREPNSPLLGAMERTPQALEVQITQEYTGQQIDLYNLAVQWEEVFAFPAGEGEALRGLMGGKIRAMAGVANVGDDENWTGHTLAQLNLYAFGRMAWDPGLTAQAVTGEWVRQTFGADPALAGPLTGLLLESRAVYEKYSTPLGLGWMVNVSHHYGPSPEGYEYTRWGTYHRANRDAVGVDRTGAGTGFARQYGAALAARFEDPATCPEELLLFFHRLPYGHRLQNGKTLLQYLYDAHFEGAAEAEGFVGRWDALRPLLPEAAYASVRARLLRQAGNAREWRDVVNTYFYRLTGVADEKGRKIYA